MRTNFFLAPLLFLASCQSTSEKVPPFALEQISGRDELISYGHSIRQPVYEAKIPLTWRRMESQGNALISDPKKALIIFAINEKLHLYVHNFPSESLEQRINPVTQIERWGSQLQGGKWESEPVSQNGFSGLFFKGIRDHMTVWAWSLQIDIERYQTLHFLAATVEEEEHYKQMAADIIIKVSGPTDLIEKHRAEIFLFVKSFQLIQEIP